MAVGSVTTSGETNRAEEARRAAERRAEEKRKAEERRKAEEKKRVEAKRQAEKVKQAQEKAKAAQRKAKDVAAVSAEAREKAAAGKKEDTFHKHVRALEDNFKNVDDKGHDDQDGTVSKGDIKGVATGDYDRKESRERLIDGGLSEKKADGEIKRMEEAARYFNDNKGEFDRLESAGAKDGKKDEKLSLGDIDKVTTERRETQLDAKQKDLESGKLGGPGLGQVRKSYAKFDTDKELNKALDKSSDLGAYSEADRRALAARAAQDPEAARRLKGAAQETVMGADSLDDLKGLGMQQLVREGVGSKGEAAEKLQKLTASRVDSIVDRRLEGRRGDKQAESGAERVQQDLRQLALDNPVLAKEIAAAAQKEMGGRADQFEDIRRADDNFLQDVGNGIKDGAGFAGDRIRDIAEIGTKLDFLPLPQNVAPNGLKNLGKGLDLVGADGLGKKVSGAGEFIDEQQDNFMRGVGEGAAGTVEGLGQIVRNPLDTAKGLGALAKDPSLLLDSYKETLDKHGVAGLLGQATFEVIGTKGAGAAVKKVGELGPIASRLEKLGNTAAVEKIGAVNEKVSAVTTKIDDLKAAGYTRIDGAVASGLQRQLDASPKLQRGVDVAADKLGTVAAKLDEVKESVGDRLQGLAGHQVISNQQGASAAADKVPVSQKVAANADAYGSQAHGAEEAREQNKQLEMTAAFKTLLESILGVGV